ncbi:MAG: hypothetical protein L0Y71_26230 [Gemmataceae bacterium]|nr:hypothetical protein [Gemmataceae bacterium]
MSQETPVQPRLDELLSRYLSRQAAAHANGLATFDAGEVTPYEAGPVQPIDPKPAWDEAVSALTAINVGETRKLAAPPHWAQLVANHEPVVALAWCVGNFPQLVRNFHQILHHGNLTELRPSGGRPVTTPALADWAQKVAAKKSFPEALLAIGATRLAKQFDDAEALAQTLDADVPAAWRAAWANERAALAWHRGNADEASRLWNAAEASLPVRFNRGMAELFLGNAKAARKLLDDVVGEIPETSAWHHLAHLYLTLAQQR